MADSPPVSKLIMGPIKALRGEIKKIIWDPFWWLIVMAFVLWVPFLRVWWWLVAPLVLSMELRILYLWWLEWDVAYADIKWIGFLGKITKMTLEWEDNEEYEE